MKRERIVLNHFNELAPTYSIYCKRRSDYIKSIDKLIVDSLPSDFSLKILDIGCGDGSRVKGLRTKMKLNNHEWIGIDLSDSMVSLAKSTASHNQIIKMDICDLNFKENEFDIILVLFNVFGYVFPGDRRRELLQKLHIILKPGGRLYLDVLNAIHVRDGEFKLSITKQIFKYIYSFFNPELEIGDLLFTIKAKELPGVVHAFFPPFFVKQLKKANFKIMNKKFVGYGNGGICDSMINGHLFVELTK